MEVSGIAIWIIAAVAFLAALAQTAKRIGYRSGYTEGARRERTRAADPVRRDAEALAYALEILDGIEAIRAQGTLPGIPEVTQEQALAQAIRRVGTFSRYQEGFRPIRGSATRRGSTQGMGEAARRN